MLGYPDAALVDADQSLKDAREIGHAGVLMLALPLASFTHILCGNYAAASLQLDELLDLADKKAPITGRRSE